MIPSGLLELRDIDIDFDIYQTHSLGDLQFGVFREGVVKSRFNGL